jgi:D-glycero-D-manno-heptose 1,7-bisphosphate phosphatase
MKKAVFFDRDGTINELSLNAKSTSPRTLKDFKFKKNILAISKYLKKKKYLLIMITNQPDVSRGVNTRKNVNEINNFIKKKINLDDIYVCFSKNDKNLRRKPNPGMLIEAKNKWNISFKKSYLIGDRKKDIIAGKKVRIKTIFFLNKNNKKCNQIQSNFQITSLKQIRDIIK